MIQYLSTIGSSLLFQNIPNSALSGLMDCLEVSVKSFEKNQVIFWAGQEITQIAMVLSGEVQLWEEDILGNRSIHNRFLPSDTFGEVYACTDHSLMTASAVAVKPTEILLIDQHRLLGKTVCVGPYHRCLLYTSPSPRD